MSQSMPSFWDSPFFVPEPDNWHLTEDAPEELKKEFAEYMKESADGKHGQITVLFSYLNKLSIDL